MLMSIIHANSFESKQFSTYFFLSNSTCPLYESFCSLFLPTSLSLSHFLYLLAYLLFLSMFSVLDVAFPFKCCITSFRNLIPRRSAFNGILHHLFISFFLESDSQTFCFFFFFFFKLLLKYSCLHFPPAIPTSHLWSYPPLALSMGPSYMFLDNCSPFSLHYPFPPPLWLLSVCSLSQCLWFCFACLFVLLIRFHLQVRSYGICQTFCF